MRENIPNTTICQYRPQSDHVDELLELLRLHRRTCVELGLVVSSRPEELYIGTDGDGSGPILVSIFQWVDGEAASRAHQHPRIGVLWEKMATLVEDRPLGPGMAFPDFEIKETL